MPTHSHQELQRDYAGNWAGIIRTGDQNLQEAIEKIAEIRKRSAEYLGSPAIS
jgi:succinate dehydrogenase/fumarate reductase flavoprotein subunit